MYTIDYITHTLPIHMVTIPQHAQGLFVYKTTANWEFSTKFSISIVGLITCTVKTLMRDFVNKTTKITLILNTLVQI